MLSKKGKEFLTLLKEAGISEYYASEEFNLEEKNPKGTIIVPNMGNSLDIQVTELLNSEEDKEDLSGSVDVWNSQNIDKTLISVKRFCPSISKRTVTGV